MRGGERVTLSPMENTTIAQASLLEALRTLTTEAFLGPPDPRGTWFVDNEADSGFVGLLDRVTAEQASVEKGYPAGGSIAAHAYHIRFALDLVLRASRGEPAFESARWSESWNRTQVTSSEWESLRQELREQVKGLLATLQPGPHWSDPLVLTGSMAVVAHGAWHLGAVRQLVASSSTTAKTTR